MPLDVCARVRGEAEKLIEDFMLLANETVAKMARERRLPALYRIHESPDPERLHSLELFLNNMNRPHRLGIDPQPIVIQRLLEETADTPEADVIKHMTLRSLKRACYGENPDGHYGLAAKDYCHFTSPIRRYPDLVVSRALSAVIRGERVSLRGDALDDAAQQSSERERAAADAERMADKIMMARVMAGHVGEMYEGVVSGVTEWGVYVALPNCAEGFIPVRTLEDWFDFDERKMTLRGERTGFVFTLGQTLCVRVENVDLTTSSIDLGLAGPLRQPKREQSEKKRERARIRSFRR